MPRFKDTLNRVLRKETHGVTKSVPPRKGRPNLGTKPYITFFADNATGDDLVPGEVVEIVSYDGIEYTIRKPSAVNLLNVAICVTKAPVGSRVELTTDGTHTVSVTGTVALGAPLGTQVGSTSLAAIAIGEANYPAVGFVAMSASSGGSCQARFFSSSLPCRQPDRAFATTAHIGVGGGTEDVTVTDLYDLRDWISANPGYSVYHATLYANQTILTDLLMPDAVIILAGQSYSITMKNDLEFRDTAYLNSVDFVFDTTGFVRLGADNGVLADDPVFFAGCAFSHTEDVAITARIYGSLFCTCTFTFDLLGDGSNDSDIQILAVANEAGSWMLDCAFVIEYLLDSTTDTQSLRPEFNLAGAGRTVVNSTLDFTTTGDWGYGTRDLDYDINCTFIDSVYNFDVTTTNTREDGLSPRVISFLTDTKHPAFERCTCAIEQDITIEGCLAWHAGREEERFGDTVGITLQPDVRGVEGMELAHDVSCAVTMPSPEVDAGGDPANVYVGRLRLALDELVSGEIIDSTLTINRDIAVVCGNGLDGLDGVGDDGGDGSDVLDSRVSIFRGTRPNAIIGSTLTSNVTMDVIGGIGGKGGDGDVGRNGGDGGRGTGEIGLTGTFGIPIYTNNFACDAIDNSALIETRTLTASGGAGGAGGAGGEDSNGGAGGQGYTGGAGGRGGDGSTGHGGLGGVGFAGGAGGDGGDGISGNESGGDGGDGGDGFASTDDGVPNTGGAGGTGGSGVGTGSNGSDGAAGDANGTTDTYRYTFPQDVYLYTVQSSTNTNYVPDWPGSMDLTSIVYIDPDNGDDENDGQSWAEAIENFPLFTRDSETVGYLISHVEYKNFTGEQIGVLRPEATYGDVTAYRTITSDDRSEFTSNPAGEKISLDNCIGDFDGFDGLVECDGTYANCNDMSLCTGTTVTNCDLLVLCGEDSNPFTSISYSRDITGCFSDLFDGCVDLAGCTGVRAGSGNVYIDCFELDQCDASLGETGFYNCALLTNCDSYDNIGWGFYKCRQLDWNTCREYDNGNSCDCPPTTKYPINCPNEDDCNA